MNKLWTCFCWGFLCVKISHVLSPGSRTQRDVASRWQRSSSTETGSLSSNHRQGKWNARSWLAASGAKWPCGHGLWRENLSLSHSLWALQLCVRRWERKEAFLFGYNFIINNLLWKWTLWSLRWKTLDKWWRMS